MWRGSHLADGSVQPTAGRVSVANSDPPRCCSAPDAAAAAAADGTERSEKEAEFLRASLRVVSSSGSWRCSRQLITVKELIELVLQTPAAKRCTVASCTDRRAGNLFQRSDERPRPR